MPTPFPEKFPWATCGRRESHSEFISKWRTQRDCSPHFPQKPLFSLIIACGSEITEDQLRVSLESIKVESYPEWEILIVVPERLRSGFKEDGNKIRWVVSRQVDTASQKNEALGRAQGDWVGFVDPGDILSPVALYLFVLEIRRKKDADLFYSNRIILDSHRKRIQGFYSKPDYSYFNLIHFNYVSRFWVLRRDRFSRLGGFNPSAGLEHEHEFLLRLTEETEKWELVPFFLYYSSREELAPVGGLELIKTIENCLLKRGIPSKVSNQTLGNQSLVKVVPFIPNPGQKLISVVICFRGKAKMTLQCLERLFKQAGEVPIEVFLVDNGSKPGERIIVEKGIEHAPWPVKIVPFGGPFNFGRMHSLVVREYCRGEFLLLLNNDVFLSGAAILDEMAAWVQWDQAGTVGILLRYEHGAVQHEGIRACFGGDARLARVGHFPTEDFLTRQSHEVFANTFAAVMMRRSLWESLGGLSEFELVNGFGDVAFNFECLRKGLRNIYLGHLEGVHLESISRGLNYEYWEEVELERRYPDILGKMLRRDLGWNRAPGDRASLVSEIRSHFALWVRGNASWLEPLKPVLKKVYSARS